MNTLNIQLSGFSSRNIRILIFLIFLFISQLDAICQNQSKKSSIALYSHVIDSLLHQNLEPNNGKGEIIDAFNRFYDEMEKIPSSNYGEWLEYIYNLGRDIQKDQTDLAVDLLFPIHHNRYIYEADSLNIISGKILNLLAIVLRRTGQMDMALEVYSQAITYFQRCDIIDPLILPAIYNNVGNAYKDMGDLSKALYYSSEGVRNCESHLNDPDLSKKQKQSISRNMVLSLMNLGLIKAKMLLHDEAILYFEKAMQFAPTYYPEKIHKILNNLGISLAKLNRPEESQKYFLAAIAQASTLNNKILLAQYKVNYSSFLQQHLPKDFSNYLPSVIASINNLNESIQQHEFTSLIKVQEAYYYEVLGDHAKALSLLNNALQTLQGLPDPFLSWIQIPKLQISIRPYIALGIINDQARIIRKLAIEENNQDYLAQALDHYIFAERLIDSLRGNLSSQESKIILNQQQKMTFRSKADLCGELFQITRKADYLNELFMTCEKGKTAGLWSEIQQADLKTEYIPDEMLELETKLKKGIAQINDRIASLGKVGKVPEEKEINEYRNQKLTLTTSLDSLLQIYNKSFPEYYDLKFSNNVSEIYDIQPNLGSKQVFIQFYFTEDALHQIIILPDTVLYNSIQNPQSILLSVEKILNYNSIMRHDYSRQDVQQYINLTYSVYLSLFGTINHIIKGKDLIIAPDSKLSLLPFESLVQSNKYQHETDFRDLNYFIYSHKLTYTYTATLWSKKQSEKENEQTKKRIIAFAPYYDSEIIDEQYDKYFGQALPTLPGTLEELHHIKKLFKSDVYLKNAATEKRLKSEIHNAEIIHLAMHTITNDDEPLQTALIFNPFTDNQEDGRLTAAEILNYRISASLTVLSACNTGSGKLREGEGVMGLARSFIQAGCPSLILNLWIMDDISGKRIINDFYSYLAGGESSSTALHNAKLKHLQTANKLNAHPHFWAGLILLGKDAEIPVQRNDHLNWTVYLAIVLLFLTILFRKKNKGSRKRRNL